MTKKDIICVAWRSECMPVSAFNYYHEQCYDASQDQRANRSVRHVDGQ